ncbi:hypothetical protein [Pseudomonas putida]|uniref:hypothetical protein n=1 Tax=Pseudomonas putida TaxID=303 RepID=UPI00128F3F39|nr:hypothetical protein [Pseudomonas putida]
MVMKNTHDITASILHEADEKLVISYSVDSGENWLELVSGVNFTYTIEKPAFCLGEIIPFYHAVPNEEFPEILGLLSFGARQYTDGDASTSSCYSASFRGCKYGYEVEFRLFNHLGYKKSLSFDLAAPPDKKWLLRFDGLFDQCPSVEIIFRNKPSA